MAPLLKSITLTASAFCALVCQPPIASPIPDAHKHVEVAETLVENLRTAQINVYGGGHRHIDWDPATCSARTVCCSFITLLLQHTYGWTDDDFKNWMQSNNPEANAYHDAILAKNGFERILKVGDLERGDILAVKYNDGHVSRNGVVDTGHVLLVVAKPHHVKAVAPHVPDTEQYLVEVIDSSASGHGPKDTRHREGGSFTGGIGKGEFRIYVNHDDEIAGYAWSMGSKSEFESAPDRDLVAGRLNR